MKLTLSVEGKVLASIPIESCKENNEYYLKAFRRLLVIRHQDKLRALKKEPFFYVEPTLGNAAKTSAFSMGEC